MPRASISIDARVAEELSEEARREKKTVYGLANESLEVILNICHNGGVPADAFKLWHTFQLMRQIEVVPLPSDFVDFLISRVYVHEKVALMDKFRSVGKELANFLKIISPTIDGIVPLVEDFMKFFPIKNLDVRMHDDMVEIGLVGVGRRVESTECIFKVLEGVLEGYGYKIFSSEVTTGVIRLRAKKT